MLKINSKAFYLDFTNDTVQSGIVCGHSINEFGFEVYTLLDCDQFPVLHARFVFETKEEAEKALAEYKPINEEIRAIKREADKKTDELLLKLTGAPEYRHLTLKALQEQKKEIKTP